MPSVASFRASMVAKMFNTAWYHIAFLLLLALGCKSKLCNSLFSSEGSVSDLSWARQKNFATQFCKHTIECLHAGSVNVGQHAIFMGQFSWSAGLQRRGKDTLHTANWLICISFLSPEHIVKVVYRLPLRPGMYHFNFEQRKLMILKITLPCLHANCLWKQPQRLILTHLFLYQTKFS